MWTTNIFILVALCSYTCGNNRESEDTLLYYYGIEESERGLGPCEARAACAAVRARWWRARALLRLCRCARRRRCDAPAPADRRVEINNRDYFQFCEPITDWPQCAFGETALVVQTEYDRMDPDDLELMHHRNIQLTPPSITFHCRCPSPNYWKLKSFNELTATREYQCGYLPYCRTGEFCGNVESNLFALYQSCLCPKNHICVHNGGVTYNDISELLYRGKGWKAYCQRINDNDEDDDY